MNENKMNPNAKLTFLERFAYGIGDYAGNLVYSAISAFLLVYFIRMLLEQAQRLQRLLLQFQRFLTVFRIW